MNTIIKVNCNGGRCPCVSILASEHDCIHTTRFGMREGIGYLV